MILVKVYCKPCGPTGRLLLAVNRPLPEHFGDNDVLEVPLCPRHGGRAQTVRLLDKGGDTSISVQGIHAWKMRELIERAHRRGDTVTYAI